VQAAREWLEAATAVAVLTGAGISAESGIPTFRGPGGLWRQNRPEDLATPQAFARNPRLVWEWYDWRRGFIARAEPNAGHRALVRLEQRKESFTLITQNVDGLHDLAGSRKVLKVHGDIWQVRCISCGRQTEDRRVPLPDLPPRCACGGMLRPAVVWFGESLPPREWREAEEAARTADVFLVVGTSALVWPAAGLIETARGGGAKIIEVNPEATPFSSGAHASLRGAAGAILPELIP